MAMVLMMCFSAMSVVTCAVMKFLLTRANKTLRETGEQVTLFLL